MSTFLSSMDRLPLAGGDYAEVSQGYKARLSGTEVIEADPARNLLLIKGAVPGMTNGLLLIRKSKRGKK